MQLTQNNFLGTPLTLHFLVQPLTHPLTYSPKHLSEMQRQELELAGYIGTHSQFQRNYEKILAEITPEFWRVADCEELVEQVNHTTGCVNDLFSFLIQ